MVSFEGLRASSSDFHRNCNKIVKTIYCSETFSNVDSECLLLPVVKIVKIVKREKLHEMRLYVEEPKNMFEYRKKKTSNFFTFFYSLSLYV